MMGKYVELGAWWVVGGVGPGGGGHGGWVLVGGVV